jgi:hypothetical protein
LTAGQGSGVAGKAYRVLLVLWAGSLWALAAWVAPTLFYAQNDRHLAGMLAGRLFSIETYAGLAVAGCALLLRRARIFVAGCVAVALLAVNEWALKPVMAAAHLNGTAAGLSFGAWHGVSALLYLLACLAVLWLVWNEDFR